MGQNTEKSPEDLRRLAVTPVKDHQQQLLQLLLIITMMIKFEPCQ